MGLSEKTFLDKIEIVHLDTMPIIQCRHCTVIEKDGQEVARTNHRHTIDPNSDLTGEDARVVSIAEVLFTEEVKAAYKESLLQGSIVP